jgi:hypothetical protein
MALIRPHPVDQLVHRDRPVDLHQQRREDTALPVMTDIDPALVVQHLDLAQQPEPNRHRICPRPSGAPFSEPLFRPVVRPWRNELTRTFHQGIEPVQ